LVFAAISELIVICCLITWIIINGNSTPRNEPDDKRQMTVDDPSIFFGSLFLERSESQIETKSFLPKVALPPDVAASISSTYSRGTEEELFRVSTASVRGPFHFDTDRPRQDSISVFCHNEWIVLALSDGISSGESSHLGSRWLVENVQFAVEKFISGENLRDRDSWQLVRDALSRGLLLTFQNQAPIELDRSERARIEDLIAKKYGATLELIFISSHEAEQSEFIHVRICGDGFLILAQRSGEVSVLVTPYHGDKSHDSREVACLPRSKEKPIIYSDSFATGDSLLMGTDGIGDLLLANSPEASKLLDHLSSQQFYSASHLIDSVNVCVDGLNDDRTLAVIQKVN